ncbi:MAG TPA: cupin domain-containing protein [Vicinamibacterales bacterium]|jgi:mannose-6-phosphate isomerase-like protein (cupin superfamily)
MIKRQQDMRIEMRDQIRGGDGTIRCINLLEKSECFGKVNLCALLNLEKGQSIGVHAHGPDAEIYYLLSGRLTATDNGVDTCLEAGDAMLTGNGETHSVRNDGDQLAVLMAVVLA